MILVAILRTEYQFERSMRRSLHGKQPMRQIRNKAICSIQDAILNPFAPSSSSDGLDCGAGARRYQREPHSGNAARHRAPADEG